MASGDASLGEDAGLDEDAGLNENVCLNEDTDLDQDARLGRYASLDDGACPDEDAARGGDAGLGEIAEAVVASFDAGRFALARERNGLTRETLAGQIGVTPEVVAGFERRFTRPSPATLVGAAHVLGLPVTYFATGRPMVRVKAAHFRSLRSTRPYEHDQARAVMSHLAEVVRVIEHVVRLPRLRLPDVPPVPEEAAREVRRAWRLPDGPVHHLIRLLESKGIVVSMTGFGASDRVDAFSCRPEGLFRPLICLSRERDNVLRRRFSAAHELGHLVLHRHAVPGSAEHEHQADRFAAEFLGPADRLSAELPSRLDLAYLLDVQRTWGLPVQSLLRRSRDLAVIDDRTYRTGLAMINRLGWARTEPIAAQPPDGGLTGEWPSLLREAVQLASLHGLDERALAAGLHLPMTELRELLSHVPAGRPRLRLAPPYDALNSFDP